VRVRTLTAALRFQPGRLGAFVGGGSLAVAAIAFLEPGHSRRIAILLGGVLMGLGCLVDYLGHRSEPDREEELAVLRLSLDVERADGLARQDRIEELERELSTHSRALARLLAD
jgi:hypothetical protein